MRRWHDHEWVTAGLIVWAVVCVIVGGAALMGQPAC